MKGVAIVGHKGGTGKTSLAHALALGAAWKGIPAYLMHTDDKEPLRVNGRPYAYYDARAPETLRILINAALNNDGIFIIDSGGNRAEFDEWVAKSMDLVLVPFIPDPEAVETNLRHMERLERVGGGNVRAIVNAYPSNRFERQHVAQFLRDIPQEKIMARIPEVKAIRTLRANDDPKFETPPARVNNLARSLYVDVMYTMKQLEKVAARAA